MNVSPGPARLWFTYKKHLLDRAKPVLFSFLKNSTDLHGNSNLAAQIRFFFSFPRSVKPN